MLSDTYQGLCHHAAPVQENCPLLGAAPVPHRPAYRMSSLPACSSGAGRDRLGTAWAGSVTEGERAWRGRLGTRDDVALTTPEHSEHDVQSL